MPCRALEAFGPCGNSVPFGPTCPPPHHHSTPTSRFYQAQQEQILPFKVSCEHPPPEGRKSGPREGGIRRGARSSRPAGGRPRPGLRDGDPRPLHRRQGLPLRLRLPGADRIEPIHGSDYRRERNPVRWPSIPASRAAGAAPAPSPRNSHRRAPTPLPGDRPRLAVSGQGSGVSG